MVSGSGYGKPILEGEGVWFSCPTELVLIGPNSTTCMERGEREPDPKEVVCKGKVHVHIYRSQQLLCYWDFNM